MAKCKEVNLSQTTRENWQMIIDLTVEFLGASTGLITRVNLKNSEVEIIKVSQNDNITIQEGDKFKLADVFWQEIINRKKILEIENTRNTEKWQYSAVMRRNFASCLGLPFSNPETGKIFGTICVMNEQPRKFEGSEKDLLKKFRKSLEAQLEKEIKNHEPEKQMKITLSALNSLSANIAVMDNQGIIQFTNTAWDKFVKNNGLDPRQTGKGIDYLKVIENSKMEKLHEVAFELEEVNSKEEVCQLTVAAAQNLLNFEFCNIALRENGMLVPRASTAKTEETEMPVTRGIAGKSYRKKGKFLINNLQEHPDACPVTASYQSLISLPVGDYGVFQAAAGEIKAFSEDDLKLAELLVSHAAAALEIIYSREKLEMFKFSLDNANLMIFRVTPRGIIEYANETAVKRLGLPKAELVNNQAKNILIQNDYIKRQKFWEKIKKNEFLTYEKEFVSSSGEKFPVEITSQYFTYKEQEYEFVFARDITERKKREKQLKYKTFHDELTGLYNRTFLAEEMKRLDTRRQLPLSIIMMDLNGLKIINDTFGHDRGDEILNKTARLLSRVVRKEDILARYGGDEFIILLPQTSREIARNIYRRIQQECQKTLEEELPVSLGIGIATKISPGEDINEVLKQADDNMLENKLVNSKSRKNHIVRGLLNTLGAKSDESREHAIRMTQLALKLGRRVGLSSSELNRLSLLATLHDVGKTSIPEKTLTKPGDLTEKEWEMIRKHPERGYKIASASEEFAAVAEDILSHHEHWDGDGYPRGLSGKEIPLLARIIAVIDAYDVMSNERPYSLAKSKNEALAEIISCAGSHFDPEIAEEFVRMMKREEK